MIEVVPTCIPETFEELSEKASLVKGLVPMMQIDISDGMFAPSRTWPYMVSTDPDFERLLKEEKGLPFWEHINYELDMMITRPEERMENWIKTGITSIVAHFESTERLEEVIEKARYYDVKIGLAFKPSTPNEEIYPLVEEVDFIQFMGNDKIGYGGVELDKHVIKKIVEMRHNFPDEVLAIDIGVNDDTAPKLVDAGITKLVSGTAIFESADVEGTIDFFQNL